MSDPDEIAHDYAPHFIAAQEARECRKCLGRDKKGWCSVLKRWVAAGDHCEEFEDE